MSWEAVARESRRADLGHPVRIELAARAELRLDGHELRDLAARDGGKQTDKYEHRIVQKD